MPEGFKVVRVIESTLFSATILGRVTAYSRDGKTCRPEGCGPLTVFDNEGDARAFLSRYVVNSAALYKCKYGKSRDNDLWQTHGTERVYTFPSPSFPDGTDFADWVELLEEVKQ